MQRGTNPSPFLFVALRPIAFCEYYKAALGVRHFCRCFEIDTFTFDHLLYGYDRTVFRHLFNCMIFRSDVIIINFLFLSNGWRDWLPEKDSPGATQSSCFEIIFYYGTVMFVIGSKAAMASIVPRDIQFPMSIFVHRCFTLLKRGVTCHEKSSCTHFHIDAGIRKCDVSGFTMKVLKRIGLLGQTF